MQTRDYIYETENGEVAILRECVSEAQARRRAFALAYLKTYSGPAAVAAADSVKAAGKRRSSGSRTEDETIPRGLARQSEATSIEP